MTWARRVTIVALFVAALGGCDWLSQLFPRQAPPPTSTTPVSSRYTRRTNSETVIVYVHGVFGGARDTWTNPDTHTYWPDMLLDDPAFKGNDIYVCNYDPPGNWEGQYRQEVLPASCKKS